jgi:hypothetical protein
VKIPAVLPALAFAFVSFAVSACQLDYERDLVGVGVTVGDGSVAVGWGVDDEERDPYSPCYLVDTDSDGYNDCDDLCGNDWGARERFPLAESAGFPGCPYEPADGGPSESDALVETDASPSTPPSTPATTVCTTAVPETCNLLDDDCDGRIDEDLGVGLPCVAGVGACARSGSFGCGVLGLVVRSAVLGGPEFELCNVFDDDCDGVLDEGYGVGLPCVAGLGACAAPGWTQCSGDA